MAGQWHKNTSHLLVRYQFGRGIILGTGDILERGVPSGSNPERWQDAKNKKKEVEYVNKLYPGLNQTTTNGTADAQIKYQNVSAVAYRVAGKTIHNKKIV